MKLNIKVDDIKKCETCGTLIIHISSKTKTGWAHIEKTSCVLKVVRMENKDK